MQAAFQSHDTDRPPGSRTTIYRTAGGRVDSPFPETPLDAPAAEEAIGYLQEDGSIYRLKWGEGRLVGRFDGENRIFRTTMHGERELGSVQPDGTILSAGLFAGGEAGWVTDEGIVAQAGLIMGEEEIGRVVGPHVLAAGGALLLLFLPDEREAAHRQEQ